MENVAAILSLICVLSRTTLTVGLESNYCGPENNCWPSFQQFMNFNASLTGEVLFPTAQDYR